MILNGYIYGWDDIEPIILASIANDMNIMCTGRHGIAKSTFADIVAHGMSSGEDKAKCIVYHMQNENMMTFLGCPNPKAFASGRMEFAEHERSILNADVAVFDEVTRAPRETENMILSVLEERRIFGKKLDKLRLVIATCNSATYKGAMKLDAAHMDRYVAVIPIPDMGTNEATYDCTDLEEMMRLNFGGRTDDHTALREAIANIRLTTDGLWEDQNIFDSVIDFCSKFLAKLQTNMTAKNKNGGLVTEPLYMSNREAVRDFPKLVMACAAYYKAVVEDPDYLRSGALEAIKYSISTKLIMNLKDDLMPLYEELKALLTDGSMEIAALKVRLTTGPALKRAQTLAKNVVTVRDHFDMDEQVAITGNVMEELNLDDIDHVKALIDLHDALKNEGATDPCRCKAELTLVNYCVKKGLEMTMAFDRIDDPVPAI